MVQFESPLLFLLLVPLVPLLLYAKRKSYADLPARVANSATLLRILGLTFIVAALARPVFMLSNEDRAVIFLLDVSDSVPAASVTAAWDQIVKETEDLDENERAGLIVFAGVPRLAVPPSSEPFELDEEWKDRVFHARERAAIRARLQELERSALGEAEREEMAGLETRRDAIEAWRGELLVEETDLEAAARLARGLLPTEVRGRLVIASDGNANRGEMLGEVATLAGAGFSVHTFPLAHTEEPEVIADALRVPAEVQIKRPFDLEVTVHANRATKGEVRIYRNKYLIATESVELDQGDNLVQVANLSLEEGFHEFEAHVFPEDDTRLENNIARGAVRVAGRPKVLLVERRELEARYLEEALAAEEIQVEVRPPTGVPEEMGDLLNYDVLVLSDVAATEMTVSQMDLIKRYVRELGGGLIMLGGEHSFGLGGYYRTPVEDALPVRMPIRKNVEKPNLGLVLVIDKSGSMSGTKIELAKEAAIASAEVLKTSDRFGVVAFDSLFEWICRLTDAADMDTITSYISRLFAGGGTNIYPALYEAYQELLDADTKLRHIIVLSDGHTGGSGYHELVSHIAADEITVSTVGIGQECDRQLLGDLAQWGGGEFYFTTDFNSIPQILTRETLRASKSMLIEEPFLPSAGAPVEALKGIDMDSMPFLLGYVATQPKELATVGLLSEYGDPILATWSYGLGRSAAFTSDAKARWAGDWISWESFSKFWGQLVRSVMSTGTHHDLRTRSRVTVEDGVAKITVDVRGRRGEFRDDVQPEVSVLESDAEPRGLDVTHVAPGLYRAEFPIEEYGDFYHLLVVQRQKDEVVGLKSLAVTESYSPEFRNPSPDQDLLELIAAETGGVFEPGAGDVWAFDGEPARTPQETWWWWLLAATLLLPLDIALRRLGAGRGDTVPV